MDLIKDFNVITNDNYTTHNEIELNIYEHGIFFCICGCNRLRTILYNTKTKKYNMAIDNRNFNSSYCKVSHVTDGKQFYSVEELLKVIQQEHKKLFIQDL